MQKNRKEATAEQKQNIGKQEINIEESPENEESFESDIINKCKEKPKFIASVSVVQKELKR